MASVLHDQLIDLIDDAVTEIHEANDTWNDRMDEVHDWTDAIFTDLVGHRGMLQGWTAHDLVRAAPNCAQILEAGFDEGFYPEDAGLWEGLTYGILGAMAWYTINSWLGSKIRDPEDDEES